MSKENTNASRLPMITASRIGFEKSVVQKMVLSDEDAVFDLFHVVGSATQAVVKDSKDYEDKQSIEFRGSFLAINAVTGEKFRSGKLYLPSLVEAELAAQVQQSGLLELAVTVTAEYAEKSGTSYTYNIKSYGKEDDKGFESMLALIPGLASAPALEAPDKKARGKKK
jgi:hypothetical protein